MIIPFEKMYDGVQTPMHAHYDDAGYDLFIPANSFKHDIFTLHPHQTLKIPMGLKLHLSQGVMALTMPRSSLSREGIVTQIPPIDAGYTGEINVMVTNTTKFDFVLHSEDRICQLVFIPIINPQLMSFDDFNKLPTRNDNGFGSTGI